MRNRVLLSLALVLLSLSVRADGAVMSPLLFCLQGSATDDKAIDVHKETTINCAIHANGEIELKQQLHISGDVLSRGSIDLHKESVAEASIFADGDIKLEQDVVVHLDVYSGDDIKLKKRASVGGNAVAAGQIELENSAQVAGNASEYSDVPMVAMVSDYDDFTAQPGSGDIEVDEGENITMSPGAYDKLDVKNTGKVTFVGGVYHFKEIKFQKDTEITFDVAADNVVIYVEKNLKTDKHTVMSTVGGGPDQVLFLIEEDDVQFDKDGIIVGTYVAPNGKIHVKKDSVVTGALYARKIEIKKGVVINGDPATVPFTALFGGNPIEPNEAPVADAGEDQMLVMGEVVTLSGSGTDADGDMLSFAWVIVDAPAGSSATIANATQATASLAYDMPGTYTVELTVSDGTAESLPDSTDITLEAANTAPVATAQSVQVKYG